MIAPSMNAIAESIENQRFALSDARVIAWEILKALEPFCERQMVVGSIRRQKATVGDIEILFVPKLEEHRENDLFGGGKVEVQSLADLRLQEMIAVGYLSKRITKAGNEVWGYKNKLAVHEASGIPVDLFTAGESNWFNYMVCRTGGKYNNIAIAQAAQKKGWKWNPYGTGFSREVGGLPELHIVTSERDVYDFVGMECPDPKDRK